MKLPPLLSDALVDAVLALSALLADSGFLPNNHSANQLPSSSVSPLQPRHLPGTSPAPDFRWDNALTRRSQSVFTMNKKCKVAPALQKGSGGSQGTNTTIPSDGVGLQGPKGGLIQVVDAKCGPSGAVSQINVAAGPNGNIKWIDCGISSTNSSDDKGWNPPTVLLSEIVYMSLSSALQDPNTPFSACNQYLAQFVEVAQQHNLPAIMMASFAMQESTCDPNAQGEGGEVGMFQLSPDKCKGVANCYNATTNMDLAANYIQSQLDAVGGNVFMMIGNYNGWVQGMTYEDATAAANSTCCHCQNNLDYVHQVVNGWYQNIDGTMYDANGKKLNSSTSLGTFNNLNVCSANPNDGAVGRRAVVGGGIPRRRRDGRTGWRF